MTNRKTIAKSSLAAVLALGTLAGAAAPASAASFSFSWSTPQGVITIGPNGPVHQVRPQRQVRPVQQISRQQARRTLRQAGYRNISFVGERPRTFVFQVQGRHGQRQVAVNKFNGRIV